MKLVLAALAGIIVAAPAVARQTPAQTLVPSVATSPQWFGVAVAASDGDRLLVGASAEGDGVVYVFERSSPTSPWLETQRIEPPPSTPWRNFGRLIDVEGDLAAIVAYASGTFALDGAVLVYRRGPSTGAWTHVQTFSIPGAELYGSSAILEGDLLLITEAWAETTWFGRVHVHQLNPLTSLFEPLQVIENVERHFNNRFTNAAVLLDEDTLVLGDFQLSANQLREAGGLLVYVRDPSTGRFVETDRLSSPDPIENGVFGHSIAWDGRQLLVSEFRRGPLLLRYSGRVYVYERTGPTDFALVQEIASPTFTERSGVSRILDLEDGQLALLDKGPIESLPSYFVIQTYQRDDASGRWVHVGSLLDPEIPRQADGASEAAFTDSSLITSSARSSLAATPQGRAFAYDLADLHAIGRPYCAPTGGGAPTLVARGRGEEGGELVLRTTGLAPGAAALSLVAFAPDVAPLVGGATLCLGGAIGRVTAAPVEASAAGSVTVMVDLERVPVAMGTRPALAGDVVYAQTWARAAASGGAPVTSNAVGVQVE